MVQGPGAIGCDDEQDSPPVLGWTMGGMADAKSMPPARTRAAERSKVQPPIASNSLASSS